MTPAPPRASDRGTTTPPAAPASAAARLRRIARSALGIPLRAVPAAQRFALALRLADALAPVIRHTRAYRKHARLHTDGAREISLRQVLDLFTATGTEYDPALRVTGHDLLESSTAAGGVLIVTAHSVLAPLFMRWLHDSGYSFTTVYAVSEGSYWGTRTRVAALQTSPTTLLTMRTLLRSGAVVCARIGRSTPQHANLHFATAFGPGYASDEMIRLAVRTGARVLFTWVRTESGGAVATIAAPLPRSEGDPEAIAADFVAFVQAQVAEAARNDGAR